jgi:hypothetical protein
MIAWQRFHFLNPKIPAYNHGHKKFLFSNVQPNYASLIAYKLFVLFCSLYTSWMYLAFVSDLRSFAMDLSCIDRREVLGCVRDEEICAYYGVL